MNYNYVFKNRKNFKKVYKIFDDNISKKTFVGSINTKLTGDLSYCSNNTIIDHLYFEKERFIKKNNEVLLDVGGFDGDSIKEFNRITNGNYKHIISLEPVLKLFKKLKKTVNFLKIKNKCTLIQIGAFNKKTIKKFKNTENDIDGKISQNGKTKINCDKIDSILSKVNYRVTYIKIDINGFEYNALKGAKNTIKKNKPFIAVKIQTKEDYTRIPIFLKQIAPNIKLRLRQRGDASLMLVLYAFFEK